MSNKRSQWTSQIKDQVTQLQKELILNNKNWHKFKSNKYRRSAELIASALSQIINDGKDKDIEELIEQSLKWIREEAKDPGCPSH